LNHPSRLILIGGAAFYAAMLWLSPGKTLAQFQSPKDVAAVVYKRLPSFPLENQYIRVETKNQATDSTLISRLIQYHTSVKGRSPLYRLDWKITLADYLGVNDYLEDATYPGHAFLSKSAMEQDRALIQKLNRSQRNALVQALVDGFGGSVATNNLSEPSTPPPKPKSKPTEPEIYRPTLQPLAAPGGANSLKKSPNPSKPSLGGEAQFLK
jgi:hypothetical protein